MEAGFTGSRRGYRSESVWNIRANAGVSGKSLIFCGNMMGGPLLSVTPLVLMSETQHKLPPLFQSMWQFCDQE